MTVPAVRFHISRGALIESHPARCGCLASMIGGAGTRATSARFRSRTCAARSSRSSCGECHGQQRKQKWKRPQPGAGPARASPRQPRWVDCAGRPRSRTAGLFVGRAPERGAGGQQTHHFAASACCEHRAQEARRAGDRQARVEVRWARALRRVGMRQGLRRQQPSGSLSGARAARVRVAEPPTYARRSVVKASFSRNRRSGAWAAHARYLSRPGAQQEFAKGLGFDSEREGIDMLATIRDWEKSDELMWRFIVSPEDADRLNLRDHVRELVGRMERDLDTKLEWVAIDHHNTDDAHVHLLVRGVRENSRPLEINRDYLRSGIRIRSQGIATRELGPRLEPEMLRSRERAVRLEQWTEIDRALQRKADGNGLVRYDHSQPHNEGARIRAEQEIDRLQFLSG